LFRWCGNTELRLLHYSALRQDTILRMLHLVREYRLSHHLLHNIISLILEPIMLLILLLLNGVASHHHLELLWGRSIENSIQTLNLLYLVWLGESLLVNILVLRKHLIYRCLEICLLLKLIAWICHLLLS